jgi:hypothetical protein
VEKAKNKILVLLILFSSVFTLDVHEFLHNHSTGFDNHCYSCLLSSSLIADDSESGNEIILSLFPIITFQFEFNTNLLNSDYTSVSDRAPPLV